MKKLFAIFTALVLCLTGMLSAAVAEEAPALSPATYTVHLNVNSQIAALFGNAADEDSLKQVSAICDVINSLGIQVVTDGVDGELILSLADRPVATSAFLKGEDKTIVLSELFPNSVLFLTQEDLGAVTGQVSPDPELIASLFTEPFAKVSMEIMSHIGAPEAVEETIHDTVFTVKTPLDMTAKELILLLLNTAKEITSSEDFAKLQETLKQMNVNFDAASIDQAIEEITNTSEEDMAAMDAGIYSNEAGDAVTRILLTKDEQTIDVLFGTAGELTIVDVDALNQLKLELHIDKAGATNLSLEFAAQEGMVFSITGVVTPDENGVSGDFKVGLSGMDMLAVTFRQDNSGELTGALSGEDKAEYTLADLQDTSGEKYAAFMGDLQIGLLKVLAKAAQAVPSVAVLLQSMMPTQPQAQPVEEPAAP